MQFADIEGVRLAYELKGPARNGTVVLAGGTGMPPLVWDMCGLSTQLQDRGYQVLTYAARGVSPSHAPQPPYSVADLAQDLAGLLTYLEIDHCSLVGYSLGGFVAELLAQQRPDLIRNAVLLASAGHPGPVALAISDTEAEMISTLGHLPPASARFMELMTCLPPTVLRDDDNEVAKWWELLSAHDASWSSPDGAVGQSSAATLWLRNTNRDAGLARISTPVLVVCFEHDLLFPPRAGRVAAAHIPQGRFTEIPGAAHGGLITHSSQCFESIAEFLSDPFAQ